MRTLRYVVADVFTDTPLAGNQLAVFTDARGLDETTMQALALLVVTDGTGHTNRNGAVRHRHVKHLPDPRTATR